MPLNLYPNVQASGSVPTDWIPLKGSALKYPVRNKRLRLLSGSWQKVIKPGNTGEIHYFEHGTGQVAGVKFFPKQTTMP